MAKAAESGNNALKLLTYNIQVGIGSSRFHHMLSHGWRYVMPHGQSLNNLQRIAEIISGQDIVGLNEADAGSFRTRYLNQADFLAKKAGYPFWEQMITRDLGHVAQHTNSVLCRSAPARVERHRLPSLMDGRGVLEVHCEYAGRPLMVLIAHLGLGRAGRRDRVRERRHRGHRRLDLHGHRAVRHRGRHPVDLSVDPLSERRPSGVVLHEHAHRRRHEPAGARAVGTTAAARHRYQDV